MFGQLVPIGGGDPIPLLKKQLRIGRRDNCDIVLKFANVSSSHCLLTVDEGYWFVKDLNSRNGVKVNREKLIGDSRKRLDPGDLIAIARHKYTISYSPVELGAVGPPPQDEKADNFMHQTLMERAGLVRRRRGGKKDDEKRFDVFDQSAGQIQEQDPNEPI